jgi:hypothetical protein
MRNEIILCGTLILSGALFGCSTAVKHPCGLPLRCHNPQYGFTFFLPADWKGYSSLIQQWNAELYSTDYQRVIGTEHGPIIVLRNPQWNAAEPYQDIPIIVFTRIQWDAVKPQRLFVGAGGSNDEISHNAKYVFGINSRHNWGELKGWEDTGRIVQQNMAAGEPHLYPDPP